MRQVILFLKGIGMGAVDTIPGFSSSTLAIILGIYEQLVVTIGRFFSDLKSRKATLQNLAFLLPIFLGAGCGILLFSGVIVWATTTYPQATQLFFIGLIVGSLPLIAKQAQLYKPNLLKIVGLVIGAGLMLAFIWASTKTNYHETAFGLNLKLITVPYGIKLFFIGFICSVTMVIPGVSGSMLMLILGEYYNVIGYVHVLKQFLAGSPTDVPLIHALMALTITALGILVGVVVAARFVGWAFKHARNLTFSIIFAMMAFSIVLIWPPNTQMVALNFITPVVGFVLSQVLLFLGQGKSKN